MAGARGGNRNIFWRIYLGISICSMALTHRNHCSSVYNTVLKSLKCSAPFYEAPIRHESCQTTPYEVSTKKVEQLKKRFVEEGFEAALYRKPVTNAHRRKITGDEEAHLIALCCSQAPEGYERWTLRMLADKMVELDIIDSVSYETVRRTLKKRHLNPGKRKNGVFRQSTMPPSSVKWKRS
jgi:transposase